jgi:hypothetical protein
MGWPADDAYSDEEGAFDDMLSAWESGDQDAITEAWNRAKRLPLS